MVASATIDAYLTFTLSFVSLIGSCLILFSYLIASKARAASNLPGSPTAMSPRKTRSKSTVLPWKNSGSGSNLIRNLALADMAWFSSSFIMGCFWIFGSTRLEKLGTVPESLCGLLKCVIIYARMASLMWTCVISWDVYKRVTKRNVFEVKEHDENPSLGAKCATCLKDYRYHIFVNIIALPNALVVAADENVSGCEAGYESLGSWMENVFIMALPIIIGIFCQFYVYFQVRDKMGRRAFPQSVRKRRRRIMYHFIIVSCVCWMPTIALYICESIGIHEVSIDIAARATLYCSGFLNFLVYGMHDPILIKAFRIILDTLGCSCLLTKQASLSSINKVDKIVMFEEDSIKPNADISKDKRAMIRYHRLSREDKVSLYRDRPDLDPNDTEDCEVFEGLVQPLMSTQPSFDRLQDQAIEQNQSMESTTSTQSSFSSSSSLTNKKGARFTDSESSEIYSPMADEIVENIGNETGNNKSVSSDVSPPGLRVITGDTYSIDSFANKEEDEHDEYIGDDNSSTSSDEPGEEDAQIEEYFESIIEQRDGDHHWQNGDLETGDEAPSF